MSSMVSIPLLLAGALSSNAAATPREEALMQSELMALHQQRLALQTGPATDRLPGWVADDFLIIDHDGARLDRSAFAARLQADSGPSAHWQADELSIRQYGDAAIVQSRWRGVLAGATETRRSTDVYARNAHSWQWVAGQLTRLKPGLPDTLQTAAMPTFTLWRGRDPKSSDQHVLRALNESYVDAFRRADVGWYDRHLASDYVVVFGDGTFHDRAAALADFAVPVFAEHLKHFPVGAVQIRQFGELAVIHAENDYERKDGRKGINRYTDIWVRADGVWRCVSAHITVFRPPS